MKTSSQWGLALAGCAGLLAICSLGLYGANYYFVHRMHYGLGTPVSAASVVSQGVPLWTGAEPVDSWLPDHHNPSLKRIWDVEHAGASVQETARFFAANLTSQGYRITKEDDRLPHFSEIRATNAHGNQRIAIIIDDVAFKNTTRASILLYEGAAFPPPHRKAH